MSFNTDYQRSKLLNIYYEKIAMTAAGAEGAHCPVFTEWAAGFGLVDETDPDNPVLLNIPPDLTEVPREFYRAEIETTYSNGQVICKCEIPVGAVETPQRFNLIGIFDQDGDLVAVCTTLPDWVTPNEADRAYPILTFPIEAVTADDTTEDETEGDTEGDTDTGETDTGTEDTSGTGSTGSSDTGDTDTSVDYADLSSQITQLGTRLASLAGSVAYIGESSTTDTGSSDTGGTTGGSGGGD